MQFADSSETTRYHAERVGEQFGDGASPAAVENIQVLVRVRPLNDRERSRGDHECVHIAADGRTIQFVAPIQRQDPRDVAATNVKALTFDAALSASALQSSVFGAARTVQLLRDAMAGYAVTVLAYGQTGSGKTFTMSGPDQLEYDGGATSPLHAAAGLIPRAVSELFALRERERSEEGLYDENGLLRAQCSVRNRCAIGAGSGRVGSGRGGGGGRRPRVAACARRRHVRRAVCSAGGRLLMARLVLADGGSLSRCAR